MNTVLKTTLLFMFSHSIYFSYNVITSKNATELSIFGHHFNSYWTYSLAALMLATPILTIANYTFAMAFHLGHQELDKIWSVIILFVVTQIFSMTIISYLLLKEIPSKGTAVGGTLAFTGLLVTMLWK